MELKLDQYIFKKSIICSNRTFMELKSFNWLQVGSANGSSNRTFMELKSSHHEDTTSHRGF